MMKETLKNCDTIIANINTVINTNPRDKKKIIALIDDLIAEVCTMSREAIDESIAEKARES